VLVAFLYFYIIRTFVNNLRRPFRGFSIEDALKYYSKKFFSHLSLQLVAMCTLTHVTITVNYVLLSKNTTVSYFFLGLITKSDTILTFFLTAIIVGPLMRRWKTGGSYYTETKNPILGFLCTKWLLADINKNNIQYYYPLPPQNFSNNNTPSDDSSSKKTPKQEVARAMNMFETVHWYTLEHFYD
jgi:hypothetical protein